MQLWISSQKHMRSDSRDTMTENWKTGKRKLPWVDNLSFHWVIVKNSFHLGVNRFSRMLIQSHNIPLVMLPLQLDYEVYIKRSHYFHLKVDIKGKSNKVKTISCTVREMMTSWVSRPEFSASVLGTTSRALAKASTPSCARCSIR